MDSDWCLFCEKHVQEQDAVYCSKDCMRKDKNMALTNNPSATNASAANGSYAIPSKRFANSSMAATYPSMFRSSTLVSSSITNRGGISKGSAVAFAHLPTSTTNVRSLPSIRSTRRQPLVLFG
ncbi:hypothetical protein BGZ51_003790 [Haplosporangium sp. Z 767]|nr:hypothetical protein BGZ51_003790 [Haplosporangium sp. Z 767]KAF9194612.1 hypothetical protein BGZ50_005972 [Haplosporangium sp. Z 11]